MTEDCRVVRGWDWRAMILILPLNLTLTPTLILTLALTLALALALTLPLPKRVVTMTEDPDAECGVPLPWRPASRVWPPGGSRGGEPRGSGTPPLPTSGAPEAARTGDGTGPDFR